MTSLNGKWNASCSSYINPWQSEKESFDVLKNIYTGEVVSFILFRIISNIIFFVKSQTKYIKNICFMITFFLIKFIVWLEWIK